MSDVTKDTQSIEKSQPVSLTGQSNTTLTNSIRITSEVEQEDVDAFLVRRIDLLMNIGFVPDWTPEERAGVVNEYRRALRHHPKWVLAKAIDRAVASSPGRPTPGNINCAAQSITKDIRDTVARNSRLSQPKEQERRATPNPEEAQRIVEAAGFTAKRTEVLNARPLLRSFADVDEEVGKPRKPHWTELEAPDSPRMQELRRARIKAGMIAE